MLQMSLIPAQARLGLHAIPLVRHVYIDMFVLFVLELFACQKFLVALLRACLNSINWGPSSKFRVKFSPIFHITWTPVSEDI
jgi:hypothetical protein